MKSKFGLWNSGAYDTSGELLCSYSLPVSPLPLDPEPYNTALAKLDPSTGKPKKLKRLMNFSALRLLLLKNFLFTTHLLINVFQSWIQTR